MRCGFHLASLPHHRWASIAQPLVQMGYRSVAVRASADWQIQDHAEKTRLIACFSVLRDQGLAVVIDGDGKFVVDPWDAHAPRLARASEFVSREGLLRQWIDVAAEVDCRLITFSVGDGDEHQDTETVLKRIAASISRLLAHAVSCGVELGIKAEIGSVIETASHFDRLQQWLPESVAKHAGLGWAADIAVMARRGELPIGERLKRVSDRLSCVYLSDMAAGVAGDMRFGSGDLAIDRVVKSLEEMAYRGPLMLRCEGYGDAGLVIAREAMEAIAGGSGPAG